VRPARRAGGRAGLFAPLTRRRLRPPQRQHRRPESDLQEVRLTGSPSSSPPRWVTPPSKRIRSGQQYASGRGPCLEAAWQRTPVRAVISAEHQRWPEFVGAAGRVGIRASLSVPLLVGGLDEEQELVGSLNVYSYTASAFDPFDEGLMRLYTVAAGQAITNAGRWQRSRETVTQLEQALTSRTDIDMAKGALMALHGCDPDEAFARLVDESQRHNIKLRDVALELIARLKAAP